jgi:hypothetical protein
MPVNHLLWHAKPSLKVKIKQKLNADILENF